MKLTRKKCKKLRSSMQSWNLFNLYLFKNITLEKPARANCKHFVNGPKTAPHVPHFPPQKPVWRRGRAKDRLPFHKPGVQMRQSLELIQRFCWSERRSGGIRPMTFPHYAPQNREKTPAPDRRGPFPGPCAQGRRFALHGRRRTAVERGAGTRPSRPVRALIFASFCI